MVKVRNVIWTNKAKQALKNVFDFHSKTSMSFAIKISTLIFESTENIVFVNQYQVDEFNTNYRRIIVENYRILYKVIDNKIYIMNVVSVKSTSKY